MKTGFIEIDSPLGKGDAEAVARLIGAELQQNYSAGVYSLKIPFEGFKDLTDKSSALQSLGWSEDEQLIKFSE